MITINDNRECEETSTLKKSNELKVLFATGIVNPNGPTFNIYYIDTTSEINSSNLYRVVIHPLSDSIQISGEVSWYSSKFSLTSISLFSDFFKGSMPTLFMKSDMIDCKDFNEIISLFIKHSVDSSRTYQFIKKYEGNPYQRISAEIKDTINDLDGIKSSNKFGMLNWFYNRNNNKTIPLSENSIKDFVNKLTYEKNILAEVKALMMAYNGSIENVIPAHMVQIDFKSFVNIFADVAIQCNLNFSDIKK